MGFLESRDGDDLFVRRGAVWSKPDRAHRYLLTRTWDEDGPLLVAVMLNPSIADAYRDDPTTRFMVNRAMEWGYGRYWAVNLFAYISTDPKELAKLSRETAIGPGNDYHIAQACNVADMIIIAWGNGGHLHRRHNDLLYRKGLAERKLYCFGVTKAGFPKFPRAVSRLVRPKLWRATMVV